MPALPPLRLLPEHLEIIDAIVELDSTALQAILDILHAEPELVDRRTVSDGVQQQIPHASGSVLDFLLSLDGLAQSQSDSDLARGQAIAAVADATSQSDELGDDVDRDLVRRRLKALLATRGVELLGRGLDLLAEHEHLLVQARIVSDVRPLFSQIDPNEVQGAVIGHVLRLTFARGEPRSIDVGIDASDLIELRDAVERAVKKESRLSEVVTTATGPLVRPIISAQGGE